MHPLLLLLTIIFAHSLSALESRAYLLESSNRNIKTNCTATLIKHNNQCRLITNFHCVEDHTEFKLKPYEFMTNSPTLSEIAQNYIGHNEELDINLLRNSEAKDLAELSVPESLFPHCENITNISEEYFNNHIDDSYSRSYVSLGFVNKVNHHEFTHGRDFLRITGYELSNTTGLHNFYINENDYFFYLTNINIIPGMSGGPVYTRDMRLIGINAKYIPFQNRSYIAPTPMIIKFLDSDHESSARERENFLNNSSHTLRNSGENEQGDGGENEQGDGGEAITGEQRLLEIIQEPLEGVVSPENSDELIIGAYNHNLRTYYQVDGFSDFLRIPRGSRQILRTNDGYPARNIRRDLFERLDGFYYLTRNTSTEYNSRYDFQNNKIMELEYDSNHPQNYIITNTGESTLQIDIDNEENKIIIVIPQTSYTQRVYSPTLTQLFIGEGYTEYQYFDFDYSFNNQFKNITLTDSDKGITLECENRNLLKLICSNGFMNFSISRPCARIGNELSPIIKYRLSYQSTQHTFYYFHGSSIGSSNPDLMKPE